jgi:hypothetical protein
MSDAQQPSHGEIYNRIDALEEELRTIRRIGQDIYTEKKDIWQQLSQINIELTKLSVQTAERASIGTRMGTAEIAIVDLRISQGRILIIGTLMGLIVVPILTAVILNGMKHFNAVPVAPTSKISTP